MIALIQRVEEARVLVDGAVVGQIGAGLLVFVAVERGDIESFCDRLARKVVGYRVFPDQQGKMNLNVRDADGALLVVSEFTLAADTSRGLRPSLKSAPPEEAEALYLRFVQCCQSHKVPVETGRFGAHMQVHLVNDGPATFLLRT